MGSKIIGSGAVALIGLGWALAAHAADLPVPPGATAAQVAAGETVFKTGTCAACHGADGTGSGMAPNLTTGTWMWSDGGLPGLTETISKGVPAPNQYRSPMPPMGGLHLSPEDLAAVSAYVWSIGHKAP